MEATAILKAFGRFDCWRLRHVRREANFCADFLAGVGCNRRDAGDVLRLSSPPVELTSLVFRDFMGLA